MKTVIRSRLAGTERASRNRHLSTFLLAVLVVALISIAQAETDPEPTARPRIGLVLGGGGAKGTAHIGVLRVLEDLRIPVDCIAGTSMGALIGGIYAGGTPADVLERKTLAIDWLRTVGNAGSRAQQPIIRKLEGSAYTNNLELGIKNGGIEGRGGLLGTQKIEDMIRDLANDARFTEDFDELPIPFRAVATDMVSGDMVVLKEGDIAVAMRASMSVPGAFAPVIMGDRVLSDGGMMRNLPVDVARDLCADVVISVRLTIPQVEASELVSTLSLVGRSMDVMIQSNEKLQLATLTERDVAIEVPMGDIGSTDFHRAPDAIALGRAAAEAASDRLRQYSLPEDEYWAWRRKVSTAGSGPSLLADVRIVGLELVNPAYVEAQFENIKPGAIVDTEMITEDTDRVFALGDFDRVEYVLTGPREARVLEIRPIEKSWGPNFLYGDLGLAVEGTGDIMAILRVDHERKWLNHLGGTWQNTLQFGRQLVAETNFYQPFDIRQRFFFQPSFRYTSDQEDVYIDDDRQAQYFLRQLHGNFDFGLNIDTRAQIRVGASAGLIDTQRDTGNALLPELNWRGESNVYVSGIYDTRDDIGLTTRGSYVNIQYLKSGSWINGKQDYSFAEGVITRSFPFRGDSLTLVAAGGKELSGNLPATRDFLLGGIRSFPGLRINELRGDAYWVAGGNYKFRLANILPLFDQALYAGLRVQAGRIGTRRDGFRDGTVYGLSGNLSARTPIGALLLSLGYVTNNSWALQIAIGRPLQEGSALDEIN